MEILEAFVAGIKVGAIGVAGILAVATVAAICVGISKLVDRKKKQANGE